MKLNNIDYYMDFCKLYKDVKERLAIAKDPKMLGDYFSKAKIRIRFIESSVILLDEKEKEIKDNEGETICLLDEFFDQYFVVAIQEFFSDIAERAVELIEEDMELARLNAADELEELEKDLKEKKAIINEQRRLL